MMVGRARLWRVTPSRTATGRVWLVFVASVLVALTGAHTLTAQPAAVPLTVPRDSLVPTLAPRTALPAEGATANVTKFSFIAYGDTRDTATQTTRLEKGREVTVSCRR